MNMVNEAIRLNAQHLLCPLPVIRLQQAINRLEQGTIIAIHCTDPGTKHDIPAWCRIHGHTCLSVEEQNQEIILYVKKG